MIKTKVMVTKIENIITSYCEGIYHLEFESSDLDEMVSEICSLKNWSSEYVTDAITDYCEGTEHLGLSMDDVSDVSLEISNMITYD